MAPKGADEHRIIIVALDGAMGYETDGVADCFAARSLLQAQAELLLDGCVNGAQ